MVTSHFGERTKKGLKDNVDQMLGRIFEGHRCPLLPRDPSDRNLPDLAKFWMQTFPREVQDAVHLLGQNYRTQSLFDDDEEMLIQREVDSKIQYGHPIEFRLRGGYCFLMPPVSMRTKHGCNSITGERAYYAPSMDILRHAYPGESFEDFLIWLENQAQLEGEFDEAFQTVNKIIDMATTIGQVRRMMPDLATYLSKPHQELLRSQQRSSSLPSEFAAFDHGKLHRAIGVLAKCHLLPQTQTFEWSSHNTYVGARFVHAD